MRTAAVLIGLMLVAVETRAEVAPVTGELAAKVLEIATKAKGQHPTSPTDAMHRFIADFVRKIAVTCD